MSMYGSQQQVEDQQANEYSIILAGRDLFEKLAPGMSKDLTITVVYGIAPNCDVYTVLYDPYRGLQMAYPLESYSDVHFHYRLNRSQINRDEHYHVGRIAGNGHFYTMKLVEPKFGMQSFTQRFTCRECHNDWKLDEHTFLRIGEIRCDYCTAHAGAF